MVKVKEVMRRAVFTVNEDISLDSVAKIMTDNRIGSVIVMKQTKPVNIVTDSDIVGMVAKGKDLKKVKARDLKKSKFITASPNDDLFKVVRMMVKNGVKRIPILQDGNLAGIVSDKEILITTPEMVKILSEKIKARVEMVGPPGKVISGLCENCEDYSDSLKSFGGKWFCEDCRSQ